MGLNLLTYVGMPACIVAFSVLVVFVLWRERVSALRVEFKVMKVGEAFQRSIDEIRFEISSISRPPSIEPLRRDPALHHGIQKNACRPAERELLLKLQRFSPRSASYES